jgi:hypothetical protein
MSWWRRYADPRLVDQMDLSIKHSSSIATIIIDVGLTVELTLKALEKGTLIPTQLPHYRSD